jgi:hypothetical protein
LLMLNPTDFNEVCVQAIHIESGGRPFHSNFSKKPFKQYETKDTKMVRGKGKGNKTATMKKEGERPACVHCQKESHVESRCWKLHPDLKPKKFSKKKKGEQKTNATVQRELNYNSGDETNITAMGLKGKIHKIGSSSNFCASSSKIDNMINEKKMTKLFYVRIISQHTKIDTLFDSGSQVNLILEEIVNKLGLETKPHTNASYKTM